MESLSASVMINNKNNVWLDDSMVNSCFNCDKKFTFLIRKHHCRYCGNIFCQSCCDKYICIPEFITDKPKTEDYWNISHYIPIIKPQKEKVCIPCFEIIEKRIRARDRIMQIIQNPIPIEDIKKLPDVDLEVKNYYLDHLRNIQYYLPNYRYLEIDKKLLGINARIFCGHSKYLSHLIKCIDWDILPKEEKNTRTDDILKIMNGERIINCQELYCTRTCQEALSCDDCFNILFSTYHSLPDVILEVLFNIISKTTDKVIFCNLPFLISIVSKSQRKILTEKIFSLINRTKKNIYHSFWLLNNEIDMYKEGSLEIDNLRKFLETFSEKKLLKLRKEYNFFRKLGESLPNIKSFLSENLALLNGMHLPYEPEIKIISPYLDEIVMKNSFTKPVMIPFETTKGKITLLLKKENVTNDIIVLNLMSLMDIILKESFHREFYFVQYSIMPLSPSCGLVEIVENAETIYNINNENKTVLQYIISKNEEKTFMEVLDKYMGSLVSYTLHSYFLGLGDRHLQNIMISHDGCIFHIDFGYILGKDSYPLSSNEIKLNKNMLDVIGQKEDGRYKSYLELCCQAVIILRKYYTLFYISLSQNKNFTEKHVENFILTRFQPRQADGVVVNELIEIIRKSSNAYSDIIRDFIHYHNQEKTLQHNITRSVKSLINNIKELTGSYSQ